MNIKLIIDKEKTALVVIDLQKGIVSRETQPYAAATVVANAAQLLKMFHEDAMPAFLVRVMPSPDMKDQLHPAADMAWSGGGAMPSDWSEIVPELAPAPSDFIITKRQWGAFYGTELDLELRRRKIECIVLCGISTDIGVESTARFAYEYGYNQIFAEDAMAAMTKEEHENSVQRIFPRIGLVRKTEEIIAALSGGDNVVKSNHG
jgi:nicotinamidase-related amidase